jgi:hypothetical protein
LKVKWEWRCAGSRTESWGGAKGSPGDGERVCEIDAVLPLHMVKGKEASGLGGRREKEKEREVKKGEAWIGEGGHLDPHGGREWEG